MTKLQRLRQLDPFYETVPDNQITNYYCAKVFGLVKKCRLQINKGGLHNCQQCWISEWEGDYKELDNDN
jgi:hypothetical protein